MRKNANIFCAVALMSAICVGFVACNEPKETDPKKEIDPWLGKEIPGMETQQISGIALGKYTNGFGSLVVQIDEEFPIGKPLDIHPGGYHRSSIENDTDRIVTYPNAIQVQWHLPIKNGEKVYISVREFQKDKDLDLFVVGSRISFMDSAAPNVPIYVVTKYNVTTN